MESDSVCDCGTGWRGSDTMGLMLTRAPPPTPLDQTSSSSYFHTKLSLPHTPDYGDAGDN